MVGVELMTLGMHFDRFCGIYAPVPGLIVSLGIDVELTQEIPDTDLILDGYKARLEVRSEGQLLVDVSLSWWISAPSATW